VATATRASQIARVSRRLDAAPLLKDDVAVETGAAAGPRCYDARVLEYAILRASRPSRRGTSIG
jgi:hypothetical protein